MSYVDMSAIIFLQERRLDRCIDATSQKWTGGVEGAECVGNKLQLKQLVYVSFKMLWY